MNWGKSIIASFVLFAIFIGALVVVCIRQDSSLVSPDYYKNELAYQIQIDRLTNTEHLAVKPVMRFDNNVIEIHYADFTHVERGELTIFRPSDERYDKNFTLSTTADSIQRFDAGQLPAGMYKARLLWAMGDKEYYVENIINR